MSWVDVGLGDAEGKALGGGVQEAFKEGGKHGYPAIETLKCKSGLWTGSGCGRGGNSPPRTD